MLNAPSLKALPTLIRDPRLEKAADIVVKAAAVLAFLFLVAGYFELPTLPVHGQDEVHYFQDFHFKLIEDARWLNYFLHDFLRSVPLEIWSVLYLALSWVVLFHLARGVGFDAAHAALVASTTVLTAPFIDLSFWPASVVPALLIACLAILMRARGVSYPIIYMVSGILLFGAMQTLYFVLPLLFLQHFLDTTQPARARFVLLFKHMLWWVAGSVAGVLVMILMLWLLADILFPKPAAWRNIQPVEDFASLLSNVRYVIFNFGLLLGRFLILAGTSWGVGLVCAALVLLRGRTLLAQWPALLLMLAVLISFFIFSIPLAPIIQQRSLIAMAAVVILFIALLPGSTPLGRALSAILLLGIAQTYSGGARIYLEVQRAETAAFLQQLQDLFPGYPQAYRALALYGTMDPKRPEAKRFNDSSLMHAVMVSVGPKDFYDCRIPGRCVNVGEPGTPISVVPFAGGHLELSVDAANNGIVRYRE